MQLSEHDVVRVICLDQTDRHVEGTERVKRSPSVGDVGTIVSKLSATAYTVECCNDEGLTLWLADCAAHELEPVAREGQ